MNIYENIWNKYDFVDSQAEILNKNQDSECTLMERSLRPCLALPSKCVATSGTTWAEKTLGFQDVKSNEVVCGRTKYRKDQQAIRGTFRMAEPWMVFSQTPWSSSRRFMNGCCVASRRVTVRIMDVNDWSRDAIKWFEKLFSLSKLLYTCSL